MSLPLPTPPHSAIFGDPLLSRNWIASGRNVVPSEFVFRDLLGTAHSSGGAGSGAQRLEQGLEVQCVWSSTTCG